MAGQVKGLPKKLIFKGFYPYLRNCKPILYFPLYPTGLVHFTSAKAGSRISVSSTFKLSIATLPGSTALLVIIHAPPVLMFSISPLNERHRLFISPISYTTGIVAFLRRYVRFSILIYSPLTNLICQGFTFPTFFRPFYISQIKSCQSLKRGVPISLDFLCCYSLELHM